MEGAQEALLGDVLGQILVDDARRDAQDGRPVTDDERLEGREVARLGGRDQGPVALVFPGRADGLKRA